MNFRTILITGGSGKFGSSLVCYFLEIGDSVIATCRTDGSLEKMRLMYEKYGQKFMAFKLDLTKKNETQALAEKLYAKNIYPDCLVNNARSVDFLSVGEDGLVDRTNFVNEYLLDVVVPYELTMALSLPQTSKLRSVLNIGSQYGMVAANPRLYDDSINQSPLHYGVAKAALVHLTKELAVRLAAKNIRVNCIAFGGVEGRVDEAFKKRYAELCPIGRMLRDDEIVGPVDMLLSNSSSGITGHTLSVDGGWSIW